MSIPSIPNEFGKVLSRFRGMADLARQALDGEDEPILVNPYDLPPPVDVAGDLEIFRGSDVVQKEVAIMVDLHYYHIPRIGTRWFDNVEETMVRVNQVVVDYNSGHISVECFKEHSTWASDWVMTLTIRDWDTQVQNGVFELDEELDKELDPEVLRREIEDAEDEALDMWDDAIEGCQ